MLEEVRKRVQEKYEQALKEKGNVEGTRIYYEWKVINDEAAIKMLKRSALESLLYDVGYPITDVKEIALSIFDEVNQTYVYVDPDDMDRFRQ